MCAHTQIQWLPRDDVWLAVTSLSRIYIYNLAHASHEPALTIALPADALLAGCSFARPLVDCDFQACEMRPPTLTVCFASPLCMALLRGYLSHVA